MGLCIFYFFLKLWNVHKSLVHLIDVYPIEKYSSALKFTVFATNSFLIFKLAKLTDSKNTSYKLAIHLENCRDHGFGFMLRLYAYFDNMQYSHVFHDFFRKLLVRQWHRDAAEFTSTWFHPVQRYNKWLCSCY